MDKSPSIPVLSQEQLIDRNNTNSSFKDDSSINLTQGGCSPFKKIRRTRDERRKINNGIGKKEPQNENDVIKISPVKNNENAKNCSHFTPSKGGDLSLKVATFLDTNDSFLMKSESRITEHGTAEKDYMHNILKESREINVSTSYH